MLPCRNILSLGPSWRNVHDKRKMITFTLIYMCEPMIEQTKPVGEKISGILQKRPARLKRDDMLKKKVGTIIKDHPKKSLSVIRRWLHED